MPILQNAVKVKILGRTCTIKTDENEDYVKEIAGYINDKIEEILKTTVNAVSFDILVLAALNIANDYFKVESEKKNFISYIENRTISLIDAIESRL